MYFTIIHWFTLIFFLLLMIVVVIISYRNLDTKQFLIASLFSIPLLTFGLIGTIYAVDSATKEAKIIQISHQEVYTNETIVISGKIENIGNFKIGKCYLVINLYDQKKDRLSHGVFSPMNWITDFFDENREPPKPLYITHEVLIAQDIEPKELKSFATSVRMPTYMQGYRIDYKLISH